MDARSRDVWVSIGLSKKISLVTPPAQPRFVGRGYHKWFKERRKNCACEISPMLKSLKQETSSRPVAMLGNKTIDGQEEE